MQALKQTPLNSEHRRLGARLTDFGGWEMPLHYGSQIEEHHHVRRAAGMFDVSHMLAVDIEGGDARALLRGVLANDVARLQQPGKALYSCMLAQDGGVLDDLIAYYLGDGWYRVVVNAGTADSDLQWLLAQRDRLARDVKVQPRRDLAIIAVQGPQARERVWQVRPDARATTEPLVYFQAVQAGELFVARTGYTGEDGFELMLPAGRAERLWADLHHAGVTPCGLGARDTLRLEAGMNLYGQDMDRSVTPMEAGLAWTVSMADERTFVGRQALERRTPRFQLLGLVLDGKGVLRSHQSVRCAHGNGEVTSGTFSPTLGRAIALARLPRAVRVGDAVEVQIRDKWLPAQAVIYPFVRHGKSLLSEAGRASHSEDPT
jgi:aminomethyltransferase